MVFAPLPSEDQSVYMADAWARLAVEVEQGAKIDHAAKNKAKGERDTETVIQAGKVIHQHIQTFLLHKIATRPQPDSHDELVLSYERFTDGLPLKQYERCLWAVPELVNLVSLADAVPNAGGVKLPFDLTQIAKKCRNASLFFAPKSFTAIQFAFSPPRSRVLLFHTGRLVGTGSNTPAAAKLSILRAVRQIQNDAGVSIAIRRFSVINLVGSGTLGARLDLTSFASAHRDSANFDRKLFVGLPWRAPNEACCAEIYSTGKMNLPGARRERDLINSYARMATEMLRMSDNPKLRDLFPVEIHDVHRPNLKVKTAEEKTRSIDAMWNDEDENDLTMVESLERARKKIDGNRMATSTSKKRQQIEQGGFVTLGKRRAGHASAMDAPDATMDTTADAVADASADAEATVTPPENEGFDIMDVDAFAIGEGSGTDVFAGVFDVGFT